MPPFGNSEKRNLDFIISGQGIAGSLIAWFLIRCGKKVLVVDPVERNTCSKIAAGLMHPITGRRIVKTWMADTLIPFARKTYTDIEDKTGERFFEDYPILELFNDAGHRNDWAGRSADPDMQAYLGEECSASSLPSGIRSSHGGRWVLNGGWLDTFRFTESMRNYFLRMNVFVQDRLDYDEINFKSDSVEWKGISANLMIDCTGSAAAGNPLFSDLPFNLCKGEIFRLKSEQLPSGMVIHGSTKLIPVGAYDYIAGGTYDFININDKITEDARIKTEEGIRNFTAANYQITAHLAGIRPSTKDRRPIAGRHREHPALFIFNGLGSKGVMLGPWFAARIAEHLTKGTPLQDDIAPYRMHASGDFK